jgi:hypothetical protein
MPPSNPYGQAGRARPAMMQGSDAESKGWAR